MKKPATKRKGDNIEMSHSVMQDVIAKTEQSGAPAKNPAAVALGRLGGLKGGKARAQKLSSEQRHRIAKSAAMKRWSKKHPSKA
jgi:hypothetical protein